MNLECLVDSKIKELEAKVKELEEKHGENLIDFYPEELNSQDDAYYIGEEHGVIFGQLNLLYEIKQYL